MHIARSLQEVTEKAVLRLARTVHRQTGLRNLCRAGGVAVHLHARLIGEGRPTKIFLVHMYRSLDPPPRSSKTSEASSLQLSSQSVSSRSTLPCSSSWISLPSLRASQSPS
jgi:hypothetical protein